MRLRMFQSQKESRTAVNFVVEQSLDPEVDFILEFVTWILFSSLSWEH